MRNWTYWYNFVTKLLVPKGLPRTLTAGAMGTETGADMEPSRGFS